MTPDQTDVTHEQTDASIDQYFPTEPWLERYGAALAADDRLEESGTGWGVEWNGAMVFEITDVPVDERTVADLPEEIVREIAAQVEEYDETELEALLETAPESVRSSVEARDGTLEERVLAELRETDLESAPERLWPELRAESPELVVALLDQLEESLTDDRTVYAWLDVHDGGCRGVDVLETPGERDHGFVIGGDYETWRGLVAGENDVISLIMGGGLEVDGDMQKLLEYTEAAIDLVDVAADMDTRFLL